MYKEEKTRNSIPEKDYKMARHRKQTKITMWLKSDGESLQKASFYRAES